MPEPTAASVVPQMDRDSTSRLSPWIHIGSISVRYIYYRVSRLWAGYTVCSRPIKPAARAFAWAAPLMLWPCSPQVKQCQAEWLAAGVDRAVSCDDFLQQVRPTRRCPPRTAADQRPPLTLAGAPPRGPLARQRRPA
jgi:hypothetical protein